MSDSPLRPSPPDLGSSRTLEIAHVLFTDIVGYSKLPMEEQESLLMQLQDAVRHTPEFARAEASEELIRLPTGDGMALVFFRDPEAPVRCALELSQTLRNHPDIKLRMGIHSGPVYRVADINANRNVAGGGINIAQRVMDCGDAGHILVSEEVANVLGQLSRWKGYLQNLGEAEVKHSVRVHLFNLYTEDAGNSALPQRLRAPEALSVVDKANLAPRRTRRKVAVILTSLALSAIIVLGLYVGLYRIWRRGPAGMSGMTITRLTNNGKSSRAAISPDGKYVAYVIEDADKQSLWVRQRDTAGDVQIIPPTEESYWDVLFSPNSDYVYFTRSPRLSSLFQISANATLYRVPTFGGISHEVIKSLSPPVSLSPDGRSMCFGNVKLMLANADGSGQRYFMSPNQFVSGMAWSPDGQTIAWSTGDESKIATVSLASVLGNQLSGERNRLTQTASLISRPNWFGIGGLGWLSDGNALIVNFNDRPGNPSQLWLVTYPQGKVERITNDLNDYLGVSITSDSTSLVTTQQQNLYSTWVVPEHDVTQAHQISVAAGSSGALQDIAWTSDGKLLYALWTGTHTNIGIMDAEGNNRRQLTVDNGNNWLPSASSDGNTIVFLSDRTGHECVWKMATDGSNPLQITYGDHDWMPSISADGKWILYVGTVSGKDGIWKIPTQGGSAVYVSDSGFGRGSGQFTPLAAVSPDSRMFTSVSVDRDDENKRYFWNTKVVAFDGKKLIKSFGKPLEEVAWSADGRSLTYVETRNGVSNIWSQRLTSDLPEQLTHFTSDRIFSYAWSHDGAHLAVSRGTETSDIVLITNFH